jgi:hypothetical protein
MDSATSEDQNGRPFFPVQETIRNSDKGGMYEKIRRRIFWNILAGAWRMRQRRPRGAFPDVGIGLLAWRWPSA